MAAGTLVASVVVVVVVVAVVVVAVAVAVLWGSSHRIVGRVFGTGV